MTVRGGLLAEGIRLSQSEAEEREHSRVTLGGAFAAQVALESRPLFLELFALAAFEASLYVYRTTDAVSEPSGTGEVATRPTYRAFIGLGYEL